MREVEERQRLGLIEDGMLLFAAHRRAELRTPGRAFVAAGVAIGLAGLPFLRPSLMPAFRERDLLVRLDAAGTSQPEMNRIVDRASAFPQPMLVRIDVQATRNGFKAGHRVRLEISSRRCPICSPIRTPVSHSVVSL